MSQNYKFKSLQFSEEKKEKEKTGEKLTVFEVGETKTIDFILLDGTRQNFAYAHYMTAWLGKEDKDRIIKIFFATHLITIKGFCLDELYDELTKLSVITIKAHDERYADIIEEDKSFVTDIKIVWKREEKS